MSSSLPLYDRVGITRDNIVDVHIEHISLYGKWFQTWGIYRGVGLYSKTCKSKNLIYQESAGNSFIHYTNALFDLQNFA